MEAATPHDVFISHSSKDKPTADAVCAALERRGIRCWVAPRDVHPGEEWAQAIIRGIAGSRVLVLLFSNHSNDSAQVRREVERAANREIPIIPFRLEDVTPNEALEYFISSPHWLDALTTPLEGHIERLADGVQRFLPEGPRPAPAAAPDKPAPATPPPPPIASPPPPPAQPPPVVAPPSTPAQPSAPTVAGAAKPAPSPVPRLALFAVIAVVALGGIVGGMALLAPHLQAMEAGRAPTALTAAPTAAPLAPGACADCTPIDVASLPNFRDGSWQITADGGVSLGTRCYSHQGVGPSAAVVGDGCHVTDAKHSASGAYQYDFQCVEPEKTEDDYYTYSGDYQTSYTQAIVFTALVNGQRRINGTQHQEGRFVGRCTAGR